MRRATPMGVVWREIFFFIVGLPDLPLWQVECDSPCPWQIQCTQPIRQGECDSPLRGQSHSPCLITDSWTFRCRCNGSAKLCYTDRQMKRPSCRSERKRHTIAKVLLPTEGVVCVNPDDIAAELDPTNPPAARIQVGRPEIVERMTRIGNKAVHAAQDEPKS